MTGPIWMNWSPGVRVTIRRHLPGGGYADTVGTLEAACPDYVEVRHRGGRLHRIEAPEIAIAHLITRPAQRPGSTAATAPGQD
ncbi:MAG: hypothetical protein LBJ02_01440 [Bifidobacteriaceae bacterium]|nr:hypothetical protein [Bifidobacteriaceae bacterium]